MALIWATEEGITKKKSPRMPLASTFGKDFRWFMRYALAYGGNYDELYAKNFGASYLDLEERGRNMLNEVGGPQMLSYPWFATLSPESLAVTMPTMMAALGRRSD